MKPVNIKSLALLSLLLISPMALADKDIEFNNYTDEEVKIEVLRDYLRYHLTSIGPCPCPDFRASNDSRCGGRSSFSKGWRAGVLCYKDQIRDFMIDDWRTNNSDRDNFLTKLFTQPPLKSKNGGEWDKEIEEKVEKYIEKFADRKVDENK